MTKDWDEYLRWLRAGGFAAPDLAWAEFLVRASGSPRREVAVLAALINQLSPTDRIGAAATIASLMEPFEWPESWELQRRRLVAALDALLRQMRSDSPTSIAGLLMADTDREVHDQLREGAVLGRHLLDMPCPRGEVAIVAKICSAGLDGCLRLYRRRLQSGAPAPDDGAFQNARGLLLRDYNKYISAARAMNDVTGQVMFTFADAPLGS